MKKFQKILLIIAACMAGLGVLFTAWSVWWSLRVVERLTPEKSVPMSLPMDMLTVDEIKINLGVGDVRFKVDDEARIEVTGFTEEDLQIRQDGKTVIVEGHDPLGGTHILNFGIFRIDWLGRLHIGTLEERVVTVYLPKRTGLETLFVEVGVGDVTGKLIAYAENASFTCSTDDLEIEDFSCGNLVCDYGTGDITLENVTVEERAEVSSSTGDLTFTDCSWKDFAFKGGTGELTFENCTANGSASFQHGTDDLTFIGGSWNDLQMDVNTGDVAFEGHLSGNCQITTSTGDVNLVLDEENTLYTASLHTSTGKLDVQNAFYSAIGDDKYAVNPGVSAPNSLYIDVSTGDITLVFAEN